MVPQLFRISKWEIGHPNLKEGDLCLLQQKKGKLGLKSYKYCHVHKVLKSRDDKVCTVEIKYFNPLSSKPRFCIVDVRKLSLVPLLIGVN